MSTIAQKLADLAQIKSDIKAAIIAKGVTVLDSDPFSDYATKIGDIQTGGGTTPTEITFSTSDITPQLDFDYSIRKSDNTDETGSITCTGTELRSTLRSANGSAASKWLGGNKDLTLYNIYCTDTGKEGTISDNANGLTRPSTADVYGPNYSNIPPMYFSNVAPKFDITIPTSKNLYKVIVDVYLTGTSIKSYIRGASSVQMSRTITTGMDTASPSDYEYTDSEGNVFSIEYVGSDSYTVDRSTLSTVILTFNTLHFRATYFGVHVGPNPIPFDLSDFFTNNVGRLNVSGVYGHGYNGECPYHLDAYYSVSGYYWNLPND